MDRKGIRATLIPLRSIKEAIAKLPLKLEKYDLVFYFLSIIYLNQKELSERLHKYTQYPTIKSVEALREEGFGTEVGACIFL